MMQFCDFCGDALLEKEPNVYQCVRCGRIIEMGTQQNASAFRQAEREKPFRPNRSFIVIMTILIILCGLFNCVPLTAILTFFLVKHIRTCHARRRELQYEKVVFSATPASSRQAVPFNPIGQIVNTTHEIPQNGFAGYQQNQHSGNKLCTRPDYIKAFLNLNLMSLPLGRFGAEAVEQLQQLGNKQEALQVMLGWDHPFIESGRQAEAFVLENCKHIYYRLRYCDQKDPAFLLEHEEYIRVKIEENRRILRDFEKLVIEVTQMNDDEPRLEPCMDVLAETLHSIRTQNGALEQQQTAPRVSLVKQVKPEPARQMLQI